MKKIFPLLFFVALAGCQPTKITRTWTTGNPEPKKYKKILVLGVLTDKDKELGKKMENHLADELRAMGYLALASNKIYPEGTFVKGDTARAVAALQNQGFEGIMTIVLLDKKKEPYYVPGRVTDYSQFDRMSAFHRYYNTVAEKIYAPGYYGEETKYTWENNFYDLLSRELVYSARTRSIDYTSVNTLAHTYGRLMAENLVKKNILVKPETADD